MTEQSQDYAFGHSDGELDRLSVQAQAFEPSTRHLFTVAGIEPGMRVLDLGSGTGDVAFLASEFTGSSGEVIGIDSSAEAVEKANARAKLRGLSNVSFVQARLDQALPFDRTFDAIVGRLVLMYVPEPSATLQQLRQHLEPGGLVAIQEFDFFGAESLPPCPTIEKARGWMEEVFKHTGADLRLGRRLHSVFLSAGLPAPEMVIEGLIGGSESIGPALMAGAIRSVAPLIERFGLATAEEIGVATFADRIRAELNANQATTSSPSMIGAWARAA
jgi:SAM-dependent methyltransferase